MTDEIKLTDVELQNLKNLQTGISQLQVFFGEVKIARLNLTRREVELEASFGELKKQEAELVSTLNSKYGSGQIDQNSGKFTPDKND